MGLAPAELRTLADGIRGSLVLPDDPQYPSVRKLFIGRIDEVLPQAVVRCRGPEDVAETLAFAQASDLPIALRSGGHSFAEYSSTGGLLIDLSPLNSVQVDGGVATVGPGIQLGALAQRLAEHDRVLPCGWCPTVGVAGAALGGGYGVLGRLYGLGADHLVAAQVVLADGRIVWADREREPELYWALRGAGGGNFGAVTSLVFRTQPAVSMTTVVCQWPYRHAAAVIEAWQGWAPEAADEVNMELALIATDEPTEAPLVMLFGAVAGNRGDAVGLLDAFAERVGAPMGSTDIIELSGRDAARHHAYPGAPADEVPTRLPHAARPGLRVAKSEFLERLLPADAIAEMLEGFANDRVAGEYRDLEFIPWRGAYGRLPPHATAFVHRTPRFMLKHTVQVGCRATDDRRRDAHRWATRSCATVNPWASGHVYPNYPDPDLPDWGRAYYGANFTRLRQVKATYDPANTFRFEQSIPVGFDGAVTLQSN